MIKPINPEALTSWVGKVPASVLERADTLAPMLKILGYDPRARRPNYGKVDQFVKENMYAILAQKELWAQRAASLVQKRLALRDKLSALSAQYKVAKKDLKEKAGDYLLEQAKEDSEEAAKEPGLVLDADK